MKENLKRSFLIIALCVVSIALLPAGSASAGGGNPGTGGYKYSGPGLVGDLVIVPSEGPEDYGISFTFTSQCRGEPFTASGVDEPAFAEIDVESDLEGYKFTGFLDIPADCTPAKSSEFFPFINNVISFTKLTGEDKIIATVVVLFEVPK